MKDLFLSVLNMSLTASYVIVFVMFLRLLLKKAPKILSYVLWSIPAFRLVIPFSFESLYSLIPANPKPIPEDIAYQRFPQVNSGIEVIDTFVNEALPVPVMGASVNPLQIYLHIGTYIWITGIIGVLFYSIISILKLRRHLKSATLINTNIYEIRNLKTPFVLGFIYPKIFLPVGLLTCNTRCHFVK